MSASVRFVIITALPTETARVFEQARRRVCKVGGSRSALAYPPHVTLRTGVLVPIELVDVFLEEFGDAVGTWDPFSVQTEGLLLTRYAEGEILKYLIGYKVRKNAELTGLNQRLLRYERWRATDRLLFEPHLTLAFDDLSVDGFTRASRWLGENPHAIPTGFVWTCDNVGLYRREGELWTLFKEWRQPAEGALQRN